MRAIFSALCALLAAQASAQSVVSMERLFTTPSERAQLDAQRNQAPAAALSAPASVSGAAVAAGSAAGATAVAGVAANAATAPCTPGVPGCPAAGDAGGAVVTAGTGAAPASEQGVQEAPGLRLDGVIRRSNGPAVLIVNGEVQPAPAGSVARGAVTLQADGRSVVLKPGQRYDPATGKVDETER